MPRFFSTSTLLTLLAFFLVFTAAVPARSTNAERFKRGLPPLKPKSLDSPTRRQTGSNPISSTAPAVRAVIKAYDMTDSANPAFLGYVTSYEGGQGLFVYNSDVEVATVFTPQLASLQPGNIPFENPPYDGLPELGFANPYYPDLRSDAADLAFLVGTTSTPKNSPPVTTTEHSTDTSSAYSTESAVWYLVNAATGEIRPQWINSDGSQAPTYLRYGTSVSQFFWVSANPSLLASNFPVRFNLDTVDVPV